MNILYANPADFHDITSGTSTGSPTLFGRAGYDYVTGMGSPIANLIVGSLVDTSTASSDKLVLTAPTAETAGTSFSLTVTAQNSSGQTDTSYTGMVHFTTSDGQAALPANYTFSSSDAGKHTFTVMLKTAGSQSITATDTLKSAITGMLSGISVAPAAPTNLKASAVSSSQITLTWIASSGATGYLVQQSLSSNGPWTQVGSTSSGSTTTFQDTGLTAGTTYWFCVIATGGSLTRLPATWPAPTTGTSPTAGSIWGNSYVPSENYYSSGSYEVGVKFTASVAGEVTGVRFYKQSWMGGYVHVGHLWTSTGTLKATATFTNESNYGWQQVIFSSPVAILANTVYIASFSTGGGYFGIPAPSSRTAGSPTGRCKPANSVPGGDGVYNRSGVFPTVNGNGMNFWADVAFVPSSSGNMPQGLIPGLALDCSGWVRSQRLRRPINSVAWAFWCRQPRRRGRLAPSRMAQDNPHAPGLFVVSQSHPTGRDTRVLDQEVVLHIRLG